MKRARLAAQPVSGVNTVLDAQSPLPTININANASSPTPPIASSPDPVQPPSEHVAPRPALTLQNQFPSIFYFCFVWHLCSSIAVHRREAPGTISWDKLLESFEVPGYPSLRLAHSSFNRSSLTSGGVLQRSGRTFSNLGITQQLQSVNTARSLNPLPKQ